jgi:hypothetical protein
MAYCCERINERSDSIKDGEVLKWLSSSSFPFTLFHVDNHHEIGKNKSK